MKMPRSKTSGRLVNAMVALAAVPLLGIGQGRTATGQASPTGPKMPNRTIAEHRAGAEPGGPSVAAVLEHWRDEGQAIAGTAPATTSAGDRAPPPFKIATKRDDDTVEVRVEEGKTVFSIHSPFGISEARIERTDRNWSETVVVRLHLNGLENFRASNGKVMLHAAAAFQNGEPRVRLWRDGNEEMALDPSSPLWMDVRVLRGDGRPAKEIPLKNGFFEMQLPRGFLADNPRLITVHWIDFYRN